MVHVSVTHAAVSIQHDNHLFAGLNPFSKVCFKIGKKRRASLIVLVIEMVDALVVLTLRPIGEARTVHSNDLEQNIRAAYEQP